MSYERLKGPTPWEAVVLTAAAGCRRGTRHSILAAAASLVQFDTLVRPSVVLQLAGGWVFKAKNSDGGHNVVLTFYHSSRGQESAAG